LLLEKVICIVTKLHVSVTTQHNQGGSEEHDASRAS